MAVAPKLVAQVPHCMLAQQRSFCSAPMAFNLSMLICWLELLAARRQQYYTAADKGWRCHCHMSAVMLGPLLSIPST